MASKTLAKITPRTLAVRKQAARGLHDTHMAVLDFQSPSAGLLATPVPLSASRTIWVVASLVAACGLAMGLIPIDKVVTAPGRLISVAPTLVVQPLETSIVRSIDVHEGQTVHAGQVLARLDPTYSTADVGDSSAQVASLIAETDRLRAEIAGKSYTPAEHTPSMDLQAAIFIQRQAAHQAKMDNYEEKISSLESTAQRQAADVQAYHARLGIATELEHKRAELEKLQVGSQINRLEAVDSRLEVARGLTDSQNDLRGALRDLKAQIAEKENYVQQWRAETSQTLLDESRKLSDAEQEYAKARLRHQLVDLRADQDAVVLTVAHVSVGSVLQSGDQFLTLVPLHSPLEVEANIAGSDAGYVAVGDQAMVKYDTFPYVKYGYGIGIVRVVSDDSFSSDQPSADGLRRPAGNEADPNNPAGLYYRVRVQIDKIGLRNTPPGFHIKPGMPITVDIKVGKRTMLGYLFSRMLPTLSEGMREP